MRRLLFMLIAFAQISALLTGAIAGDLHHVCQPHSICAGNSKLVGGYFTFAACSDSTTQPDTFRIISTGTGRVLGVLCDENPIIPRNLTARINDPTNAQWDRDFRGDYEVCPFTPSRPGDAVSVRREDHQSHCL